MAKDAQLPSVCTFFFLPLLSALLTITWVLSGFCFSFLEFGYMLFVWLPLDGKNSHSTHGKIWQSWRKRLEDLFAKSLLNNAHMVWSFTTADTFPHLALLWTSGGQRRNKTLTLGPFVLSLLLACCIGPAGWISSRKIWFLCWGSRKVVILVSGLWMVQEHHREDFKSF